MSNALFRHIKNSLFGREELSPAAIRALIEEGQLAKATQAIDALKRESSLSDSERLSLQGEILFREHRDDEAQAKFQEALRLQPNEAGAHYGMSLVLAERGDFEMAAKHAQFACSGSPDTPRFLAQLGYCHLCLGNLQVAEGPLLTATRLNPNNARPWNNLGIVNVAKQRLPEAIACFETAVRLDPTFSQANEHLADTKVKQAQLLLNPPSTNDKPVRVDRLQTDNNALRALIEARKLQEAIDLCESLVLSDAAEETDACTLLQLYEVSGDPQSGIESLESWLARHPRSPLALKELGLTCNRMNDFPAAEKWLGQALPFNPDDVELLQGLGLALARQERFEAAKPHFQRALDLTPENSELLGLAAANLANLCEYLPALAACEQLQERGIVASCHGPVLAFMGRFDEAEALLNRSLAVQPQDANLRMHRASIKLLKLDFEHGWDDYAFRTLANSINVRVLPFPLWRGEPLEGKKIAVLAEQGLGDQVMFASCLPDLLALKPAKVVVEAIDRIAPTLARSFPDCEVLPSKQDHALDWLKQHPDMDYFIAMGDLPFHFRRSLNSFPDTPRYLMSSASKVAYWDERIKSRVSHDSLAPRPKARIGFSWRGGTTITRAVLRTLEANVIAVIGRGLHEQIDWVCLQYGDVSAGLDALRQEGVDAIYWPESIKDLDQFAALIDTLDLVITVCNTTVHYAGALGTPVWILAPYIPEWRYGIHNASLPWYPSSKVMRQEKWGEWDGVLEQVHTDLRAWLAQRASEVHHPTDLLGDGKESS
jgi:Flp pilus assembly protein TadD